jgi:Rho-binding antiterminator
MPAMPDTPAPYVPIDCEFHDVLEATATRRATVVIRFLDDAGLPQQRDTRIVTLSAHDGIEYAELATGERVRLDRLLTVDGIALADFHTPD